MNPRIVFFGNSKYSVIDAEALHARFTLTAAVTLPDYIDKKNTKVVQSPVKLFANTHTIPVLEVQKITAEIIEKIKAYQPDFLIVADYGLILPATLLSSPVYASLNVHHSLLPKYRGPAPAPAAILNGDEVAGVSIIVMSKQVDAGDVLKQVTYRLKQDETTDSLLTKLNTLGAQAVIDVIQQYLSGTASPEKQDESQASHTTYMKRSDGLISLTDSPILNWRKIRAYGEWPGTYFIAKRNGSEIRVKIREANFADGILSILRVIPENKKEMSYEDFMRGMSSQKK
ncbi:MAG: hypothetical protein A2664_02830 [Candidatus Taylorbacteria bacterium RIFCSPHIGHO2_01_FULL_46_22b]|uniref:methionyl-tRNA formyltransferase n=1 Tax=Candidatus Taylorbacteria bacterium RIFCSPHIGHO2_01_FULL_46_22b TaxID=1802301 RepID=A0A1G2M3V4_9BACT|nr:MAG: hypothetical protein A2664_02830 [Candidatus Taylorbacteria bacterium RIFCSPHIGHO2_01_FULL_46_22b]